MNKTNKNVTFLSSIGLIAAPLIWGFSFVVVKDSLDSIGPVWMIALRYTIAFVLLSVFCAGRLRGLNLKSLRRGAVLGVFLFLAYFFQTVGCKYTTAGKNAFLTTIYVVLVPLLGWPLFGKKPGWHVALAALLCLSGIGLISLGNGESLFSMNLGDILTLVCGVFYALHILYMSRCNEGEDALVLTVIQFGVAAVLGWCIAPFYDGAFPFAALQSLRVVFSMLFLGIFASLVAFVLQNVGLKYVPPALASLFLSLEAVFGMASSVIFLHEKISPRAAVGCTLIFSSILLAEVVPQLRKKTA